MLINYFKTAWRNLWNSRFYTSINIAGLSIGLAVGILILLWVKDELSFDRFHHNANNIYRVNAVIGTGKGSEHWTNVTAPIGNYAPKHIPAVKNAVRIVTNDFYSQYSFQDKKLTHLKAVLLEPSFFSVFDLALLQGNAANPFPDDQSILITQQTAHKFFGNEDPIGKVIVANNTENYIVRGIVQDLPANSSLQFDIIFSFNLMRLEGDINNDFGNYYFETYLLLQPGASTAGVEKLLTDYHHKQHPGSKNNQFILQPLTRLHLYGADGNSSAKQMVMIFFMVALLLLLIACINYVNLSTARALARAREVSVRKIIGAGRGQLFMQFVIETAILFALATFLAICLIALLMPLYNAISGKQTVFTISDPSIWQTIGIAITGTLIASSIYPALLLSSFKPLLALKGKIAMGIGNVLFRRVLVVSQFVFSVVLIIGTLIIGKQLRFIRDKELGYDRSQVFTFSMRDLSKHFAAAKADLLKNPAIKGVASGGGDIVNVDNATTDTDWDGKETNRTFLIHPMAIDDGFVPLMKIQFAAGGNFMGAKADSAHYILNETAVKEAGITDPIGKRFSLWSRNGTIIGVVKDFHYSSLKQKIEPAIFYYKPGAFQMYIRTSGKEAATAIAAAQAWWKRYNPDLTYEYSFLDDTYDRMYKSDQRTGVLFNWFAGIAILISCLGLFGLSTYTAQVKTKEIGIRKVLGASVFVIARLLTRDFVMLVALAIIVATPIAWYIMNNWLQNFAYRTPINGWVFLAAAALCLLIALLTVSYQSIKAALANPVKSLRTE